MWVSFLFIGIAYIFKALSDNIKHHWYKSIFRYIKNEKIYNWIEPGSWRNKWKDGDSKKGERYWGSSRWFVIFTDAWHLSNFLMTTCFMLALFLNPNYVPVVYHWLIDLLICRIFGPTVFEFFYSTIFEKE